MSHSIVSKRAAAAPHRKWRTQCRADKIFDIVNHILMALALLLCFYPLYYIVVVSFSQQVVGSYLIPNGFTLVGYQSVFKSKDIWQGYANTIFYTVVGTVCSLMVTLPCAYALSRKDFFGRGALMGFLMVTMFISGGLVPSYLNMSNLHLIGTRAAIILSGLTSTYNIVVARSFFSSTIPVELLEASRIDGCGNGRFFAQIVLPLSKPIIAVMALYFGVARWNSYFNEMIYLRDTSMYPLSLVLRRILWSIKAIQEMIDKGELTAGAIGSAEAKMQLASIMQYCIIVVSTLPMMIIYPFLQKYFAKGVMIGSVKG